ncbi:MAG: hypothetical protein RQ746_06045 [Bacteroidales bacterium]|nr:hypothetical protein [Bacteroidales bacterium]
MKKFLAVLALVAFLGGMSAPAIANDNAAMFMIEQADKDPKKAKKAEKSAECSDAKKAECGDAKKAECGDAKKADCEKKCDGDK